MIETFKSKDAILLIYLFSEKCKELNLSEPFTQWSGDSVKKTPQEMTQWLFKNQPQKSSSLIFYFENSGGAYITKTKNSYQINISDNDNTFTETDPASIIDYIIKDILDYKELQQL